MFDLLYVQEYFLISMGKHDLIGKIIYSGIKSEDPLVWPVVHVQWKIRIFMYGVCSGTWFKLFFF